MAPRRAVRKSYRESFTIGREYKYAQVLLLASKLEASATQRPFAKLRFIAIRAPTFVERICVNVAKKKKMEREIS